MGIEGGGALKIGESGRGVLESEDVDPPEQVERLGIAGLEADGALDAGKGGAAQPGLRAVFAHREIAVERAAEQSQQEQERCRDAGAMGGEIDHGRDQTRLVSAVAASADSS